MNSRLYPRFLATAGAFAVWSLAPAGAVTAQITTAVNESDLLTLHSNLVPEAIPANDRGRVADSMRIDGMMLLLHRNEEQEKALDRLIHEQLDRHSVTYHKWLTAREFGVRYGLAQSDIDAITSWLKSHGFEVATMPAGGRTINFSGTARQVSDAFRTEISRLADGHYANMSVPRMPRALASAVYGVVKLNDFEPHPTHVIRPFTYKNGSTTYHAVVPEDLATIYNVTPVFAGGNSGQGQTIVVLENSDVGNMSDWTTFRATFGLSVYTQGSFTEVHPQGSQTCADPGAVGSSEAEANLDAQWASAAAPSAAIVLASCRSTAQFGGFLALENLVNGSSLPAVVSISYGKGEVGDGETENKYISSLYQQASAEGVSVFVSAGDAGAAQDDVNDDDPFRGVTVNGYMSTPYDVAVGGTDFADTYLGTARKYWNSRNDENYGSAKSYIPEMPWDESCANVPLSNYNGFSTPYGSTGYCNNGGPHTTFAGGGGPSNCATGQGTNGIANGSCKGWKKPDWQVLLGVADDKVRDTPDVSLMSASAPWGHNYIFCDTDFGTCGSDPSTWIAAGGTSFATPIWAGFMALIDNKAGGAQGLPNPTLYSLANQEYGTKGSKVCNSTAKKGPGASCVFYDIMLGDNDLNCVGTVDCYLPSGTEGVLSTKDNKYKPAYSTQKGWDFATGIGTVNVENLVNAWP